jgi:hypothetical protein
MEKHAIKDPLKVGLIYIKTGNFGLQLKSKTCIDKDPMQTSAQDWSKEHQIVGNQQMVSIGHYLDDQKLH